MSDQLEALRDALRRYDESSDQSDPAHAWDFAVAARAVLASGDTPQPTEVQHNGTINVDPETLLRLIGEVPNPWWDEEWGVTVDVLRMACEDALSADRGEGR